MEPLKTIELEPWEVLALFGLGVLAGCVLLDLLGGAPSPVVVPTTPSWLLADLGNLHVRVKTLEQRMERPFTGGDPSKAG